MAELVDALDSKSGYRKVVQVRFLFWAQSPNKNVGAFSICLTTFIYCNRLKQAGIMLGRQKTLPREYFVIMQAQKRLQNHTGPGK